MSARWYSKHEMEITDKQLTEENVLNANRYKEELKTVIDKENHRQNVDRAKKKAVTQRMDYDGFHQMVLGADLKGLKKKEMMELKPEKSLLNTVFIHKDLVKETDIQKGNYSIAEKEENPEDDLENLKISDEFNISIFEREWRKRKETQLKLEYFSELENEKFKFVLTKLMDGEVFLDAIKLTPPFILEDSKNIAEVSDKYTLLLTRLLAFVESQQMSIHKKFISKKIKQVYTDLNEKAKLIFDETSLELWTLIYMKVTS